MRFQSKALAEHVEVPLADEGRFDALLQRFVNREPGSRARLDEGNTCLVIGVRRRGPRGGAAMPRPEPADRARLAECVGLVEAQGDRVVAHRLVTCRQPSPRTLVSRGVAEQIGDEARDVGADLIVFDAELTPSQTRNLEGVSGVPVADREAIILNVFERRARTPRAKIQVELAHLEYLRPRIRGIGLNMDQQAGPLMGSRGPGETASELLARRIDGRIAELRRRLGKIQAAARGRRAKREGARRLVLVGYTNAGKTTLMNALTGAGLSARDRPFETLDTTARCLTRHGGDVLLSDTVGFVRDLPRRLFESFASTLDEVVEASGLVVVLDASDPDLREQHRATAQVLERLGAEHVPRIYVFTKQDRPAAVSAAELAAIAGPHPFLRTRFDEPASLARLRERLLAWGRAEAARRTVFVPYECGDVVAAVYRDCRVLQCEAHARGTRMQIEGEPHRVAAVVDMLARRQR